MQFNEKTEQSIKDYLETPPEQRTAVKLSGVYWQTVEETLLEMIHQEGDVGSFLSAEYDFINFGVTPELYDNAPEIRGAIENKPAPYHHLSIACLGRWIQDTMNRIYSGDKRELCEKDIKRITIEKRKVNTEIEIAQNSRKELLIHEFGETVDKQTTLLIENLVITDTLNFSNMQTKRLIAKGVFISIDERREFVNRTTQFQKEITKNEALFARIKMQESKKAIKTLNNQIVELQEKIIAFEDSFLVKEKELEKLDNVKEALSPIEVENRMRVEIEYLRDMTRLCARRLHMEPCSVLKTGDRFFTLEKLHECFNLILEFDPLLFNNERMHLFGKPGVLLIPGNGNTLFDWKNNLFIVPLMPPNGDFVGSIASGIIEYRLDVDDDKKLLNSYQKIPEYKEVRSIVVQRANLTKDYIKWVTSEYNGFKVLSKDVRTWFEHEIAPKKTDIFCPPHLQPYMFGPEDFKKLLEATQTRIADKNNPTMQDDLWTAGILAYQQGKFPEAITHTEQLLKLNPEHIFAYFNLAIMYLKVMKKQESIQAMAEFMKLNPRTWWTGVAAEHLRRLRLN